MPFEQARDVEDCWLSPEGLLQVVNPFERVPGRLDRGLGARVAVGMGG